MKSEAPAAVSYRVSLSTGINMKPTYTLSGYSELLVFWGDIFIVTDVPPSIGPLVGLTSMTVGTPSMKLHTIDCIWSALIWIHNVVISMAHILLPTHEA